MSEGQSSNTVTDKWDSLLGQLRNELGDTAFESWVKPLTVDGIDKGRVRMSVPTRFMRNWVDAHYGDRIRMLWSKADESVTGVDFIVQSGRRHTMVHDRRNQTMRVTGDLPTPRLHKNNADSASFVGNSKHSEGWGAVSSSHRTLPESLSAPLNSQFTFDNFVVGEPNQLAYAAARRVSESQQPSMNPLFLYSGVGLGKTHLMHAIAWNIRNNDPSRTVVYLSAESFLYRFVKATKRHDTVTFKEQFRSVDVLMIDDVQFIAGKEKTLEEFLHTYNSLIEQGSQIILSADRPPVNLEKMDASLKSRLNSGLVIDINPTTYDLRLDILHSKAAALGANVPDRVLEFLAHKISSNVRELEGALRRVVANAQLVSGREITLETTQDLLRDTLRAYQRRVTVDEIQRKVAEHFNISMRDMLSKRRSRSVARPRQVAMYLSKQLTPCSLPNIGEQFKRDHTTVMHAVRKIEELKSEDTSLADDVELLRRMLEN